MLPKCHLKPSLLLFYIFFNIHKNLTEKVSLAVSTIELVRERGSTKAFTMKSSWRWSHRWKCVSLKRINIEHIFGFVHADIYTWNFSFLYYSPKLVFTFFSLFHTYNYLSFHNFPSYSALV